VIEQVGYRPNLAASNLRRAGGRTRSIGLLLSDVSNPLNSGIQRAIEEAALERGFVVISSSIGEDPERERELVDTFTERRVDGLIIVPAGHDHSYLAVPRATGMSIVFVDRPPTSFDTDAIVVDNRHATARAVSHLIASGHRRIGFLGASQTIYTARERVAGYCDALTLAGFEPDESLIRLGLCGEDDAHAAAMEMLRGERTPTAVFTAQNMITIGMVRALRTLGVHRSVALACFDDIPLFDLLDPAVTVLAQDPHKIGRLAARTLFERIDGSVAPSRTHLVPVTLIARGSGEITGPHAGAAGV
jgi:LacI family transcriptional regulator